MYKQKKAFTLIELLVVISIIALLMAILMPTLGRVRRQAKAVLCQSRLKQWGLIFSMYTEDNNGYFMNGQVKKGSPYYWPGGGGGGQGSWWFDVLRPYYEEKAMLLCPMATKTYEDGGQSPFGAWLTNQGDAGSYGMNGYIINTPPGVATIFGRSTRNNWKNINVKGAVNIPLLLDCLLFDGWPLHFDEPPEVENWFADLIQEEEMKRFCINRHNGFVNALFFDFSVRPVGLKELWDIKWSRGFNTDSGLEPVWPDWMKNFKDY